MERISKQTIEALTANDTDELEFKIPSGFQRWTLHVVPIHAGGGSPDEPTADVLYWVADDWRQVNGTTPAAAVVNKANVVTREDVVARIKLTLLNGATVPDGGAVVELWGDRAAP